MNSLKLTLVASLMLGVSACSLAPDFALPKMDTPATFTEADVGQTQWKIAEPAATQERGKWWAFFNDRDLDRLQEEAMTQSPSLQAMAARVTQARETANIARGGLFPTVDGNSSFTRQQPNAVARGQIPGIDLNVEDSYKVGLGLSYELDLFGRVLNDRKAANADADSVNANYESLKLAMQADVAALYFTIRAADAEIALLKEAVKIREESVAILHKRLEIGTITELDSATAIVDLETTRSDMFSVIQSRKESEHALAVLLGLAPEKFQLTEKPFITDIPVVPAGIPSALLERRPDITAAEYNLMAANARIGIAKAGFFPNIALTASGGLESNVLGELFQWSSRSWAFGPLLTLPIFSGGKIVANHNRSKAQYEEAVANYKLQVLSAFRDVEDGLSRIKTLQNQKASQDVAAVAAKRADDIAQKRYDNGDLGYLEAITARQNKLQIERYDVQIHNARLNAAIQLVRALGGGWE